jgi:hypothetical protein
MAVDVVVKCLQVLRIENRIAFVTPKNEFKMTLSLLYNPLDSSSSFSRVSRLDYKLGFNARQDSSGLHDDRRSHIKHRLDWDPICERGGVWRVVAT